MFRVLRACQVVIAALMGCLMGYFLAENEATLALISFISGFAILVVLNAIIRSEASKLGTVLYDEMHYTIAEKTGLLAFKISLAVIAIAMIVTVLPEYVNLNVIPESITKLYPGLGLSMAILVIAYWIAYLYYSRSKKPIEGR